MEKKNTTKKRNERTVKKRHDHQFRPKREVSVSFQSQSSIISVKFTSVTHSKRRTHRTKDSTQESEIHFEDESVVLIRLYDR
jgi:hypothetical protein